MTSASLLMVRLELGLGLATLTSIISRSGSPSHLSMNYSPLRKRPGSLPGRSQVLLTRTLAWMESSPGEGACVISSFQ